MKKAFFVASTGQHVGKTTICLGLVSGLKKLFKKVSYLKPIGQEHVEVKKNLRVDKDVVLFRERFDLKDAYASMSPVLFPRGFTRNYLDGKINEKDLAATIQKGFDAISKDNDCIVIEGTGHVGVGDIVNLNNAQVAASLDLNLILIASGGLGSSFDALALNKLMCDHYGVKVAGVILNRVLKDKKEMVSTYMEKALSRWNIPILGCIPFDSFLSNPSMQDFESLFNTTLLTGKKHHLRHFQRTRLIATSLETYHNLIEPFQLIITPTIREDIILATLSRHWDMKVQDPTLDLNAGMILTGDNPPSKTILAELKKADIPMFYAPFHSYEVMEKITSFTAKIRKEDEIKVTEAINLVESHIDFKHLCQVTELL